MAEWNELTLEFVEFLSDTENQSGFVWVMVAQDMFPEGVDPAHPRLLELSKQARDYYEARKARKDNER